MKWQDIGIFFKKRSRSRTLWIGSGASIFTIFAAVLMLTGTEITTSGDVFCSENCELYVNITSTYWEVCFSDTEFEPLYFNQTPIDYEVFVPTRGAGNWRPIKVGDCIKRKNKYNYLPNRFLINITKESWQTLKYGVEFGSVDIDPFLFSSNVKIIDDVTYEKLCIKQYQKKIINTPYTTMSVCDKSNLSCKPFEITKWNNTIIEEEVGCKLTGEVKKEEETIKEDNFFCGLDKDGIICDEYKDNSGGLGDGNGDGICQTGETCIRR